MNETEDKWSDTRLFLAISALMAVLATADWLTN